MSETIPGGNINQTAGDWGWRQNPGLRNPNPIPSDAANQANITPPKANPIAVNQDPVVPNKGKPLVVTKDSSGKTLTANGAVPGTTITFNSPA